MNDSKLINKVITIKSKEEKPGQFGPMMKIKDEQGLTYTVYKTKKDGTVSEAWKALPEIELESSVQIGFASEIKPKPTGEGSYEARIIRSFNKDIGSGVANYQNNTNSRPEPKYSVSEPSKDDSFWDKKAYKQCLWGFWLEHHKDTITNDWKILVWEAFNEIEQDAEKRFNPLGVKTESKPFEDLPVIQQDDGFQQLSDDDMPPF